MELNGSLKCMNWRSSWRLLFFDSFEVVMLLKPNYVVLQKDSPYGEQIRNHLLGVTTVGISFSVQRGITCVYCELFIVWCIWVISDCQINLSCASSVKSTWSGTCHFIFLWVHFLHIHVQTEKIIQGRSVHANFHKRAGVMAGTCTFGYNWELQWACVDSWLIVCRLCVCIWPQTHISCYSRRFSSLT